MHKVLKLILITGICSLSFHGLAQKKYALLVGADNYYSQQGVLHTSSLRGCVNDARAINQLLLDRFGYENKNIFTLFNADVTKKNLLEQMYRILRICEPGDVFLFYYSGHGVWMTNTENMTDSLKKGMSQAIVMTNLYAPGWECIVRDETLKEIMNQFVDKKVISTVIFDCCYSAFLMMAPGPDGFVPDFDGDFDNRSLNIRTIPYEPLLKEPEGCKTDSNGLIIDQTDSDRDGFPDCMDWEINSPYPPVVNEKGIRISDWERPDPDSFFLAKDPVYDSMRSYNLKDAIVMNIKSTQARPSERINSAFLSLAASSQVEKSLEIKDISGIRHGAFTAAIMHIYKTNSANLKVSELITKVREVMLKQTYLQGPTPVLEPGRAKGNLLGIPNTGFSDRITTKVQMTDKGKIILDKGTNSGILKGNKLIDISVASKPVVEIVEAFPGSAIGIEKSGRTVSAGHTLELKDHYTVSAPLVKIYIPSVPVNTQQYAEFLSKQIIPLGKKPNFVDEKAFTRDADKTIIFWETREKSYKNNIKVIGLEAEKDLFYMMLPVPAYIAEPLKTRLKKNQNMELVTDPAGADFVLYISYSKNKSGKPQYIFTFHSPKIMTESLPGNVIPLHEFIVEPTFLLSGAELQKLTGRIYENAKTCLRRKTTAWINEYERR